MNCYSILSLLKLRWGHLDCYPFYKRESLNSSKMTILDAYLISPTYVCTKRRGYHESFVTMNVLTNIPPHFTQQQSIIRRREIVAVSRIKNKGRPNESKRKPNKRTFQNLSYSIIVDLAFINFRPCYRPSMTQYWYITNHTLDLTKMKHNP